MCACRSKKDFSACERGRQCGFVSMCAEMCVWVYKKLWIKRSCPSLDESDWTALGNQQSNSLPSLFSISCHSSSPFFIPHWFSSISYLHSGPISSLAPSVLLVSVLCISSFLIPSLSFFSRPEGSTTTPAVPGVPAVTWCSWKGRKCTLQVKRDGRNGEQDMKKIFLEDVGGHFRMSRTLP